MVCYRRYTGWNLFVATQWWSIANAMGSSYWLCSFAHLMPDSQMIASGDDQVETVGCKDRSVPSRVAQSWRYSMGNNRKPWWPNDRHYGRTDQSMESQQNEYVPLCQQLDWTTSVRFSPDGQIVAGACTMERLNCGTSKQGNVSTLYPDINGCPCCSWVLAQIFWSAVGWIIRWNGGMCRQGRSSYAISQRLGLVGWL